jgi:xanthine dehydrogenase accessory factor
MDRPPRRPRLALFGAGPAGQAFARQFALLPFTVEAYDDRAALAAHAVILPADELVELAACLEPGDFAVIASSSHDLDFRLAAAVLRAGVVRYCGMIGSRRKAADVLERLAAEGLGAAEIARLSCPIGIPSLHGRAPETIAVSVAAQLLQVLEADEDASASA